MFNSPEFWVGVGFFAFVGLALYFGATKMVTSSLDDRSKRIADELAAARRLREEAQALVTEYEGKRKAAETEAAAIVASAREEAERVAREAHEKMADFVARRTASAEAKIAQAEQQATAEVRAAAVDAAIRASEAVLRDTIKGEAANDLLAQGVAEVKAKLN